MDNTILVTAADHVIKSVTIFKSEKAEVVRTFKLTLKPGQNKVEITGLSNSIDTHSVRVSNLGDARLFDVICTVETGALTMSHDPNSRNEIVRVLRAKRAGREREKDTLTRQEELLQLYGRTLNIEHITPYSFDQFLLTFAKQRDKNTITITEINEEIHQIDKKITKMLTEVSTTKGASLGKVVVVIVSDEESLVELKLSYIVSHANWHPTYELHASTEGGKPSSSVSLHYRARITQSTGEDWNRTSLTLSNIMSGTKTIPQLLPVQIHSKSKHSANPYVNPQQQTAVVTETPMAIPYSVAGKSTIPSDGLAHQMLVAVLPFEANISYITSPCVEPVVYIQCQVQNKSEYWLLPGPLSVILDDRYVSKTDLQDINTGDMFTCTLGDDPSVKVTYLRSTNTVKSNASAFTEAASTTTYTTRASIHNKHTFAISELTVREMIPTSQDKQVKVILRKPKGLEEAKGADVKVDSSQGWMKAHWQPPTIDGGLKRGEEEGKLEWSCKVDAGAKVVLEAEWEVKTPADLQWYESTAANH